MLKQLRLQKTKNSRMSFLNVQMTKDKYIFLFFPLDLIGSQANTMLNYTAMADLFFLKDRWSWVAAFPFCRIHSNLSPHENQQCEHDFVNQKWLETATPHPCRSFICHQCHFLAAGSFLTQEKNHFFWLFFPIPFFIVLVMTDYNMPTVMVYDHYMTICKCL